MNNRQLYSIYYKEIPTEEELILFDEKNIDIQKYIECIKKTIPNNLLNYCDDYTINETKDIYSLNFDYLSSINNKIMSLKETRKPVIIFFSMIDYYFRIQRNQHMCRILAERGCTVFYVKTRFDKDFMENKICENLNEINLDCDDDVSIYTSKLNNKNVNKFMSSINKLRKKYNFNFFISYVANPFWYQLLKYINNTNIIYDCVDYHDGFGNISNTIIDNEKKLLKNCDSLIITSPVLAQKLKINDYHLIRNGCDFEYFNNIKYVDINKKIICYYGAVSDWFDVELVEKIALEFKDCIIYIIGNVYCNDVEKTQKINNLTKIGNVKIFGEISYNKLFNYLKYISVGIIPFEISPLIECTNPVKLYEMLSFGLPVVMTFLPDVLTLKNDDLYYLSKTHNDFINNIKTALNENNEILKKNRIEYAENNQWSSRVDDLEKIIKKNTPFVSIILLCYNNWNLTEQCIISIIENTNYENYELIIVNNNSTDETKNKLKKIKKQNNMHIINNEENYGFAKGMNIGALHACGEYLVLLNNDTYCMKNWLYPLLKPYFKDNNCGIVSSITNNCGNEVKQFLIFDNIKDLKFKSMNLQHNKLYKYYRNEICPFFAPLIKKELFYKIGMLDVNYGRGGWEDDDFQYSLKLYNNNINNYYTFGSFIYHQESATMGSYNVSTGDNKLYYEKKWKVKWIPPKYKYENMKVYINNEFVELIQLIKSLEIFTNKKILTNDITNIDFCIDKFIDKQTIKYENYTNVFLLNQYKFNKTDWNLLEIYKVLFTKKNSVL